DHLRDSRLLLPDGVVDAADAEAPLVDDRVDGHGRLARLPVADDELALAAADGHHAVDGLAARLQRFLDRRTIDDARRQPLDRHERRRANRTLAVDRLAKRVDDAAHQLVAHRDRDDAPRALDRVA